VDLISVMAEAAAAPPTQRDFIDDFRDNRVILLDGPRGSGKTTTLLTILRHYLDKVGYRPGVAELEGHDARPGTHRSVAVIPLPVLDLHPLDDDYELLVAIAGRFRKVNAVLPSPTLDEKRARDLPRSGQAWARLAEAIAMSGVGSRRRAQVGPDVYSVELRGAQTDVAQAFRELIDALTEDVRGLSALHGQRPLFLLTIDDADLVPRRTYELIQVLRSFHDPRVGFLLTGDSQLFVRSLRAAILEQLWDRLTTLPTDPRQLGVVEPADYATQLAREMYDRVIPRTQRCHVDTQEDRHPLARGVVHKLRETRRRFLTLPLERRNPEGAPTLGALLLKSGPCTMPESLLAPPVGQPQDSETEVARWRLPGAVPSRLRTATDFSLELDRLGNPSVSVTCRVLQALWRMAVDGSSLSQSADARLRDCVQLRRLPGPRRGHADPTPLEDVALRLDGRDLAVRCTMGTLATFGADARFGVYAPESYDVFLLAPGSPVRGSASDPEGVRPRERVSDEVADALALIVDASRFDQQTIDIEPLPLPAPASLCFVGTRVADQDRTRVLAWPFPATSYFEIDRFAYAWEQVFDIETSRSFEPVLLFAAYVRLVGALLKDRWQVEQSAPTARDLLSGNPRVSVASAIDEVTDIVKKRSTESESVPGSARAWLASLGALVAPGFGLPERTRKDLSNALHGAFVQDTSMIRDFSCRHLRQVASGHSQLGEWIEAVERTFPQQEPSPAPAPWAPLDKVSMPRNLEDFTYGTPQSLGDYVSGVASRATEWLETGVEWPGALGSDPLAVVVEKKLPGRVVGARLAACPPELSLRDAVVHHVTVELQWENGARPAGEQRALGALAWDVRCDLERDVDPSPEGWDFPGVIVAGRWRWPAPAFPAAYDLECFAQHWSRRLKELGAEERDVLTLDMLVVDYLAIWEAVSRRTQPEANGRDLGKVIDALLKREMENIYARGKSPRWRAYTAFRDEVVVLAAPEMGLSGKIANTVLEHARIGRSDGSLVRLRREVLTRQAEPTEPLPDVQEGHPFPRGS
jgi:hypothetical protein